MVKAQTLKGFRDFLPIEAKKRQYVLNTLKKVFESYGFEPLETPALEYEEVLAGKYGDEGDKLMYKFTDNGQRKVVLRFDQTVPLARVVAQYQNDLSFPFKRYQMQNVWRAENTQKGRYREFLQVDTDIVGSDSPLADAEIIALTAKSLETLGFKNFKILINDRKTLSNFSNEFIRVIDKLKKIGVEAAANELVEKGIEKDKTRALEKIENLEKISSTDDIKNIIKYLGLFGVNESKIKFSPSLARGLDYYTGTIFEIEVGDYDAGSIAGGGRYDNLVGIFTGKDIPAVGFSFGFDRLIEAMNELNLFPKNLETVKVLITNSGAKSLETANKIRENGINAELYLEEKDLEKQLKYADKKQIPYSIIFDGENLILKNMKERTQENLSIEEIIKTLS